MKKTELVLALILIPLDWLVLVLAGFSAYILRFETAYTEISPVTVPIPFSDYALALIVSAFVLILIFAFNGLYTIDSPRKYLSEINKIIVACSLGLVFVVFLLFFQRDLFSSRFIILVAWGLSILFVSIERLMVRAVRYFLYKKGVGVKNVLLIGNDNTANALVTFFKKNASYGVSISQHIAQIDADTLARMPEILRLKNIDEILQTDANVSNEENRRLIDIANELHLKYTYTPDFYGAQITNVDVMTVGGIPIVALKRTRLDKWGYVYKRVFDMIASSILILLFSPILVCIYCAIRLDSSGPAVYKNERIGRKGKAFFVYKFRTMFLEYCTGNTYDATGKALETEAKLIEEKNVRQGPLYKVLDDPRRTRVGKFLEKTSLDELPQFFNVWIGNMSLVGPRPHQPREVNKYESRHKQLLEIKPGITGLAQISGRSDLDFEDEATLDIFYIENWSFFMDIVILLKTPFALIRGHRN